MNCQSYRPPLARRLGYADVCKLHVRGRRLCACQADTRQLHVCRLDACYATSTKRVYAGQAYARPMYEPHAHWRLMSQAVYDGYFHTFGS